jgi:pSer/pThr/pTyr-binding forkhead associated (FHA) protein
MAMPPASTELETMGKMIIIGGLEPREVPLPSAQFTVGRFYSPENNVLVALDEKSVSRKHAVMRIAAQGREFYIQDVGSTYGTHIIAEGRFDRLQPGMEARVYNQDVVQFGSAVRVQLVLPCETRSAITQL